MDSCPLCLKDRGCDVYACGHSLCEECHAYALPECPICRVDTYVYDFLTAWEPFWACSPLPIIVVYPESARFLDVCKRIIAWFESRGYEHRNPGLKREQKNSPYTLYFTRDGAAVYLALVSDTAPAIRLSPSPRAVIGLPGVYGSTLQTICRANHMGIPILCIGGIRGWGIRCQPMGDVKKNVAWDNLIVC